MKRFAALISVWLVGLIVLIAPASADPEESGLTFIVEGQGSVAVAYDALLDDIEVLRGARHVAPDDPILWQNEFADTVTALQRGFPADYSGSALEDGRVWVSFVNKAPSKAVELLTLLPGDIEVREFVGWSEVDIREMGEAIHYAVLEIDGVVDVDTSIDTNRGRIDVQAEAGDSVTVSNLKSAGDVVQSSYLERPNSDLAGIELTYEIRGELQGGFDAMYGGAKLGHVSTSAYCTSGFSVRNSSYPHGLLTADHCSDSLKYGSTTLSYGGGSGTRDVQWHRTSATTTNARFYVTSSTLRTITSSHNPFVGTSLCKYGRTTGNTCDQVYLLNQCRGAYCGLAAVYNRKADSGDSGGPWYIGNAGYGVHSGYKTISGSARDMFTPLQNAASTLGVVVKLG